jgi:hypothetical protein
MILSKVGNALFHVLVARLSRLNGGPIRFFGNGPFVVAYLHANPDTDFLLEAVDTGQQLGRTSKARFSPASDDVFCGRVRFNSVTNEVTCSELARSHAGIRSRK